MRLERGRSVAVHAEAFAGSIDGTWASVVRGELTLRAGTEVIATAEIPAGHDGPLRYDGAVIAVGRQRFEVAARAWWAVPDVAQAVLPSVRAAHPTADVDQLRVAVAAWADDVLIAAVRVKPPRDDRRWDADAPTTWLVAFAAGAASVLSAGHAVVPPAGLAAWGDAVIAGGGSVVLWTAARGPHVLSDAPARACALADGGRIALAAPLAGGVVVWDGLHPRGPVLTGPVDGLAGHPCRPLVACLQERALSVVDVRTGGHTQVELPAGDAALVGWDAIAPLVLVSTGDTLTAWSVL